MKARISEVFESIQGEGLYIGERQIFVRFHGCNLNCKYCDTKPSYFSEYSSQELFEEIILYGEEFHSVSFTGGEPLLQEDFLKEMLQLTKANGYKNYLETNGILAGELAQVINYVDIISMDLKLPSSTGMGNLWSFHRRFLEIAVKKEVFLKAVVCLSTEAEDLISALSLIKAVKPGIVLVLQPNSEEESFLLEEKTTRFREICVSENICACVIPQMHKKAGVP